MPFLGTFRNVFSKFCKFVTYCFQITTQSKFSLVSKELIELHVERELQQADRLQSNQALKDSSSKVQFALLEVSKLQSQVESLKREKHQVFAERNNYKQKADSLSKEMARFYRLGVSVSEIEHVLEDRAALQQQILDFKNDRDDAVADLARARESRNRDMVNRRGSIKSAASSESSVGSDIKSELERVISELTEYVSAKEMQLETVKEINRSLTAELRAIREGNEV